MYMDTWERFDETLLPDKKAFYSELNLEDVTDKDYEHAQKVWEVFKIKNIGEYHDLYVQSDALLLADVFENFRDKCIWNILKYIFVCTRINMASMVKKDISKFRIINKYWYVTDGCKRN